MPTEPSLCRTQSDEPEISRSDVVRTLQLFVAPGQVTELRALGVVTSSYRKPHTEAGFFDDQHLEEMAIEAIRLSRTAQGVYFTLNPLNSDLLARCCNRTDVAEPGSLSTDKDVERRRWLLVDVDPQRVSGVSAAESEKERAFEIISAVREYLSEKGWPDPILADSGNGFHLLYRIDLPTDDGSVIKRVLHALGDRFSSEDVTIDRAVFNASRLCKLYGTIARKGDHTPNRPHRQARLIHVPSQNDSAPISGDFENVSCGGAEPTQDTTKAILASAFSSESPQISLVSRDQLEALAETFPASQMGRPAVALPNGGSGNGLTGGIVQRARNYLGKILPAVSGEHGHDRTFHAACVLIQGFDFAIEEALPILQEWNRTCQPPWEEADLRRKLNEADKQPGPRGNLLYRGRDVPSHIDPPPPPGDIAPWPELIPFGEHDLPAFPVDALPDWLRCFVEALARATQTPIDLPAMLGLAAVAAASARKCCVVIKPGWIEPLNLFVVVSLPSGNRKSAVFSRIIEPIEEAEERLTRELRTIIAAKQEAYRLADERLKKLRGVAAAPNTSLEKREAAIRDAAALASELAEMEVPARPRLIAEDVSPEKLGSLLAEQNGRMALLSPEGDIFDIMAGRYTEKGDGNFAVFLKSYSGETLRVDRLSRPADYIRFPALTLGLTVQPCVLESLSKKPGFRGRGLLGRFLYSLPTSFVGFRDVDPPPVSTGVADKYRAKLTALLELAIDTGSQPETIPQMKMSKDARNELKEFETLLEPKLAPGGALKEISDWAGKLAGSVGRIAALLHVAERVSEAHPWGEPIELHTMQAAVRIGHYLIPHAVVAFEGMETDPEVSSAKRIVAWLQRAGVAQFTKRDVHVALKGHFKRAEQIDRPLSLLAERGYIQEVRLPAPKAVGRPPSPLFVVNPRFTATTPEQNPQNSQKSASIGHSVDCVDSVP